MLYLRFALWWLDLNLLRGPDALKKVATKAAFLSWQDFSLCYISLKAKNKKNLKPFLKASRGPQSFAAARGTVVESDRK